jgi:aryl-alcohol dehydrogenase-like predicted oxidoreductase
MRYKLLGKSGLRVSELCLGTMTFGEDWGWGADHNTSKQIFDTFLEAGGNFIDTANLYTAGTSEKYVGEFVKADRDALVVATKYTLTGARNNNTTETRPNVVGNHRKNMIQSVEASLKNMNLDYIDILYVHAWDFLTPVQEVMRALDDLVRQGKILYVAASDTPAWITSQANVMADLMGWSRFLGIQAPYSLLRRDLERAIMPMARQQDMAVLPWGILHSGILTGKFLQDVDEPTRVDPNSLNLSQQELATVQAVIKIADEIGKPPAQVAINWVRGQQHKAQIIPILGARKLSQLQDNLACLNWSLSQDHLDHLDTVSAIDLGFPQTFITANPYIYGDTFDLIDNHRHEMPVPVVKESS